jgi:adenylate kinase family enzyme
MKKYNSGSIVGVFGLPCSGKTTVIKTLVGASRMVIATISTGDIARKLSSEAEIANMAKGNLFSNEEKMRSEILNLVSKRRASGAELIIIDSCPRSLEQVEWCLKEQLVGGPGNGCLVQIMGDRLHERAQERMRDDQDAANLLQLKIDKQQKEISKMDSYIMRMGIDYWSIMNIDLALAVKRFAQILGLRK